MPTKKERIMKILEKGPISIEDLAKEMHYYKQHLLENWVFKLNAERKIVIDSETFPNFIISKKE